MKARRQYKNAPIEEALVEFRFTSSGAEWDLTIPGKLHQHPAIRDAYSGKPRTQRILETVMQAVAGQAPAFNVQQGVGGIQLVDADAKRLLGLKPDVLSVHVLRPYEGWEKFRPRVDAAVRAYREVSGVDSVVRIGLRYVNRIVIPVEGLKLGEYFTCGPRSPDGLPNEMAGFLTRVEYVYEEHQKLIMTFASLEALPGSSAFLLDLDTIWEGESLHIDSAMSTLDALKEHVGSGFESLITDKLREVFDAG